MDLALLVYAISLLEKFQVFFGFVIGTTAVIAIGSLIYTLDAGSGGYEYSWNLNKDGTLKDSVLTKRATVKKALKWSIVGVVISSLIQIMIPSERTAYTMVGAYAAQKVVENEKVAQMSGKVLKVIEQKLDSYVDDGIEEAKKKANKELDKHK